jgi:FixJ family two-component response regulator
LSATTPQEARTVHVVDDDASMRGALARLLKLSGWNVRMFESAEAFLAERETLPRGCLVLDIQLTGMSGLDLLERLAELNCSWPVVAMSGSHDDNSEPEALRLGARIFLRKPFEPQAFLDAIELALAPTDPA